MRHLSAAILALLLSWQASADPLTFAIYRLEGDKPELLAQDRLDYTASDIDVQKWGHMQGEEMWKKSLKLMDGFSIGALVVKSGLPDEGFGLWIDQDDHPSGFSWEWFHLDNGNVYKKLQGEGYVRAKFAKCDDGVVLQSVEFMTDIKLRFDEDVKTGRGHVSHEVVVTQGSVLRFPE